jgi:hypothetical protein
MIRVYLAIPFLWCALLLLKIAECFNHVGELLGDEPCACGVFKPGGEA